MSLADKMDILEVIARYAYTYDGRDADGFAQLFTEDGIFEVIAAGDRHPELRLESRAAIHAWVVQRHHQVVKEIQDRHYQTGTLFDVLTQEQAQTRTMVLITHQGMHDPTPRPVLSGVYHDRWHKTQGGTHQDCSVGVCAARYPGQLRLPRLHSNTHDGTRDARP